MATRERGASLRSASRDENEVGGAAGGSCLAIAVSFGDRTRARLREVHLTVAYRPEDEARCGGLTCAAEAASFWVPMQAVST